MAASVVGAISLLALAGELATFPTHASVWIRRGSS
jgi:hypothetical protein